VNKNARKRALRELEARAAAEDAARELQEWRLARGIAAVDRAVADCAAVLQGAAIADYLHRLGYELEPAVFRAPAAREAA
jgi:hypothetical protein